MIKSYLVIKLTERDLDISFDNVEELTKRSSGEWRITPAKVGKIKTAFVLYKGQIIAEYYVGNKLVYDRDNGRTTFDLKLVKESKYKGKFLESKTSNPCYTIKEQDFQDKLSDFVI